MMAESQEGQRLVEEKSAGEQAAVVVLAEPAASQPRPKSSRGGMWWKSLSGLASSVQSLAATVVIAVFVITFVVQAFQIPSESMENTLLVGDYLLVDKVHFGPAGPWSHVLPYRDVKRGDVVVFRYPVNPQQHFVKRVIGVPGDRIHLVDKQVWVNDQPLRENYAIHLSSMLDGYRDNFPAGNFPPPVTARWYEEMGKLVKNGELRVPPGHYFVLGDNRDESLDSRYWGFVPQENIVGRPLVIYFSVASADGPFPMAEASSGKLSRFAQALSSVVREVRWDRTLKIVK